MTLDGIVGKINEDGTVSVCLRDTECDNCESCVGCTRKQKGREINADNDIGASVGDRVTVRASNTVVAAISFCVLLLPVALTVSGYAIGKYLLESKIVSLILMLVMLAIGIFICALVSKKLSAKSGTVYKVISYDKNA